MSPGGDINVDHLAPVSVEGQQGAAVQAQPGH